MRLQKKVDFCAAHSIQGAGKCANKHGHNWEATITVDFHGTLNSTGFIVDVAKIKQAAYKYDHDDLDNYFAQPSTENVVAKIANDVLQICLDDESVGDYFVEVHLVETKNNSASATCSAIREQVLRAGDQPTGEYIIQWA
jgi:6-pyruvoyl-tetrahydropterin synthase